MKLYSVRDVVSGQFAAPVAFNNDGSAIRWFNSVLTDSKFPPSDFQLFKVAVFNELSGIINVEDEEEFKDDKLPIFICQGEDKE